MTVLLRRLVKLATALADLVAVRSKKGDAVTRALASQVRLGRDTIDVMIATDVLERISTVVNRG